jgi:hypothetical protein
MIARSLGLDTLEAERLRGFCDKGQAVGRELVMDHSGWQGQRRDGKEESGREDLNLRPPRAEGYIVARLLKEER